MSRFVNLVLLDIPPSCLGLSALAPSAAELPEHRNRRTEVLPCCDTAQALKYEPGTHVVSSGALATTSGQKTGRSPKDKRVVREEEFEKDVWWGKYSPNYQMDDR